MHISDDDQAQPEQTHNQLSGSPDVVSETITALTTGIPPQIQRSFFKAVHRVFLAGAEWPAKYLEGRARKSSALVQAEIAQIEAGTSDTKARQKAREIIYRDSAKAAAKLFTDADQAERALMFHASDIAREQSIREDVIHIAAENLKEDPPTTDAESEIDDDWLYMFLKEASKKSHEEYKIIFGKILSGEIRNPGSFSISTMQIIPKLNKSMADIFLRACNISTMINKATIRLITAPTDSIGENFLGKYGLNYSEIAELVEFGLIRSELSEFTNLKYDTLTGGRYIEVANEQFLMLENPNYNKNFEDSMKLYGPAFTICGRELRKVVQINPSREYIAYLSDVLAKGGIDLYSNIIIKDGVLHGKKIIY